MVDQKLRSPLIETLQRSAEVCERTLAAYADVDPGVVETPFGSSLLLAAASLREVASAAESGVVSEALLRTGLASARAAARTARSHGLDERLLRCTQALTRAATYCAAALGESGPRLDT